MIHMSKHQIGWCKRLKIETHEGHNLMRLARIAERAQVKEHNTGTSSDDQTKAFEDYAVSLGFSVSWMEGISPVLLKDGNRYTLPDDK